MDSFWIVETMKISGALSDMLCQPVEKDWLIFVPEYKQVNYNFKNKLILDFKNNLRDSTLMKNNILNILSLTKKTIENSSFSKQRKRVKNIVGGLYSVFQKDMGHKPVVMNISYIQVPNFIYISDEEENQTWIEILEEHITIINNIDENNGTTTGLMEYQDFISSSNVDSFFDFSFWYAAYLSNKLSNKQYAKAFSIDSLNKLYSSMDKPNLQLMEIINNRGFQAVAKAIRNSTVSLQYISKEQRQFEIRYGVAQTLQTKSKSSEDLAVYIGEYISVYNSETARYVEKKGLPFRANVRIDELNEFYTLLDKYPSHLIGALLASYGFALGAKSGNNDNDDFEDNEE